MQARVAIQISPPNLSEGGSLRSPIRQLFYTYILNLSEIKKKLNDKVGRLDEKVGQLDEKVTMPMSSPQSPAPVVYIVEESKNLTFFYRTQHYFFSSFDNLV